MKLFFLLFFLFSITTTQLKADHLLGFEISYVLDSATRSVKFSMNAYRDCRGILGPDTMTLNLSQANSNCGQNVLLIRDRPTVFLDYICGYQYVNSCSDGINGNIEVVEIFHYESDYIPLDSLCGSNFTASVLNCCRSLSITNLMLPGTTSMNATVDFMVVNNNSPIYNNLPIQTFCAGMPASYSPQVVELDGDSLHFELIPVTHGNYYYYYNAQNPLLTETGTSLSINGQTGEITFLPRAGINQLAVVMVKISEYRNGQFIGSQTRELSFKIQANCQNNPPVISNILYNGVEQNPDSILYFCPNTDLNLSFTATDIDSAQNLNVISSILQVFPNAQMLMTGSNPLIYDIHIPLSDLSNENYILQFLVIDDACPSTSDNLSLNLRSRMGAVHIVDPGIACSDYGLTLTLNRNFAQYLWSTGETTSSIIANSSIQNYAVTVSNGPSCVYIDSISVSYFPAIDFDINLQHFTCNNNIASVEFLANTSNYLYVLNMTDYNYDGMFNNVSEGLLSFTIVDTSNYCQIDTIVEILRISSTTFTPTPIASILCYEEIVSLSLEENFVSYQWSTGATTASILNSDFENNYEITVVDTNGCQATHTFNLLYRSPIDFTAEIVHNPCENYAIGQIILRHIPNAILYDYTISSGDTSVYYGQFSNLLSGNYTITATDANHCTRVENYTITDLSYLQLIDFANDTIIEEGSSVLLFSILNSNANIITENWTLPAHITNVQYINSSDVNIMPLQSDNYNFYIENQYGCFIDTSIYIQVIPSPIDSNFVMKIPTAFSPNGDGENDLFKPLEFPQEYIDKMQIFNRWGNTVYDSDVADGGWDGNYKNQLQPRDVYIYIIKYTDPTTGENQIKRGEVLLMR